MTRLLRPLLQLPPRRFGLLLALGSILLRLWLLPYLPIFGIHGSPDQGVNWCLAEIQHVAERVRTDGCFCSPYVPERVPTAHVSPAGVGIAVALQSIAGGCDDLVYPYVLVLVNCLASACTALTLVAIARRFFAEGPARLVGVAWALMPRDIVACLLDAFSSEYDALALAGTVLCSLRLAEAPSWGRTAALGGVGGLAMQLLPPTVFVVGATILLTGDLRRMLLAGALAAAPTLAWGVHNQNEMGSFITTRSNFGLELDIGVAPEAEGETFVTGASPAAPGIAAKLVHPAEAPAENARYRAMGELPYYRARLDSAVGKIEADPTYYAWRVGRRAADFWSHPWYLIEGGLTADLAPAGWPSLLVYVLVPVGLVASSLRGLVRLWRAHRPPAVLLGIAVWVCPTTYWLIHLAWRYHLPFLPMLLLLAACGVVRPEWRKLASSADPPST